MKITFIVLLAVGISFAACKKETTSFSHVYNVSFQLNDITYKPKRVSLNWIDSSTLFVGNATSPGDPRISIYMITTTKTRNVAGPFIASASPAVSYPNIGSMEFGIYIPNATNTSTFVYTCPYFGPHNNPSIPINEDFSLTITGYDSSYMHATFRGVLTDTATGERVTIKNGEFNIPYTTQ